jgi:hypothetical protein
LQTERNGLFPQAGEVPCCFRYYSRFLKMHSAARPCADPSDWLSLWHAWSSYLASMCCMGTHGVRYMAGTFRPSTFFALRCWYSSGPSGVPY